MFFNVDDSFKYRVQAMMDAPNTVELRLGKDVLGLYVDGVPNLITGVLKEWTEQAKIEPVRLPGYWIHKEGETIPMGQAPNNTEKVVYFLHGGAYIHLSAHPDDLSSNIPRGLLKYCESIKRSFAIDYRLCSVPPNPTQNTFPTALIDALAGYAYLVNTVGYDPSQIIVCGDSAGGNLALALTRYLVEYKDKDVAGLPSPPGALLLLSPWCDMSGSHITSDSSFFRNAQSDLLVNTLEPGQLNAPRAFIAPFQTSITENPYLSPSCKTVKSETEARFKDFPRAFITAGDSELLLDEIRTLQQKMKEELGQENVRYYEAKDAFHDYTVFAWAEPERTETHIAISEWVKNL